MYMKIKVHGLTKIIIYKSTSQLFEDCNMVYTMTNLRHADSLKILQHITTTNIMLRLEISHLLWSKCY